MTKNYITSVNGIELIPINNLVKESFFIPAYQRGYRWKHPEVTDLLDDIWEFSLTAQPIEFYCLQPIVVKNKGTEWEVIDGQQRLTTIFIILNFLKKKCYTISFETRIGSQSFLNDIDMTVRNDNIDYFHICEALESVETWFSKMENSNSCAGRKWMF